MNLLDFAESAMTQKDAFKASTAVKQRPVEIQPVFGRHDPETYRARYRALPEVGPHSSLGLLFGDGRGKHLEPLVSRQPREILPRLFSFEPGFLRFLDEMTTELDRKLTPDVDEEGFTRTGLHAPFAKLRCPAGYLQTPMSAKVVDNALLREELGLTPGYSPKERAIATMVWRDVWGHAKPSSVNVPNASAGGMRRFTHDVQWKLDYARWKTEPRHYDRFLQMVEKSDVYGLANEFEIVYGMYVQKRLQLDEIGKVRMANDWEYALTGGRKGKRSPTDKDVVIDGRSYPTFSALRVRVIDAGPWAINCDLQMVATSHMRSLFDRYPQTFHINTDEEIKKAVDGKYVYCSDVSEYDQSMSADALAVVFETMREFYPEGIARSAERLYQAPYYAKPLSLGGKVGAWIHHPMDWEFAMSSGNRSGHAFTSLVAKVNKVIETLCVIDRLYSVTPSTFRAFLRAENAMGTINNGDDEITWALASADLKRYADLRKDRKAGHYVITPEVGQGFSGKLLVRPNPSETVYFPQARLQTPLEKCYVPERSIGGKLRPYWPIGWLDRIDAITSTDMGREVWEIHTHYYRKHLSSTYGSISEILLRESRRLGLDARGMTKVDREVLIDPDKLHYKYTDDDVSQSVLATLTSNIPKEYVGGFLRRYYTGVIQ